MKKSTLIQSIIIALLLVATVSVYTQNMSLKKKVEKFEASTKVEEGNLKRFDDLDFIGWSGKNVKVFEDIHSSDVRVEGTMNANDLAKHSNDAQSYFKFLKEGDGVVSHPVKLADGDWTAVIGETRSTVPDTAAGAAIGATTKKKGFMLTLAKWSDGKIKEEYLFSLNGDANNSFLNKYIK